MVATGEFVAGLFLTLAAGVLNGGWNICVKDSAPSFIKAVDTAASKDPSIFTFDHAWAMGMFHAAWFNVALCLVMLGPETISGTVQAAAASDLAMIVLFSVFWGIGTWGFGFSIQIAGIGMGTTLTMSVIVVVGTLLPLLIDVHGKLLTTQGCLIVLGLAVCGMSFVFASLALRRKDADEAAMQAKTAGMSSGAAILPVDEQNDACARESDDEKIEAYTTVQKVAVCCISGLFCTTLQFAFVFSEDMRDIAQNEYGVAEALSPAITFVFAISICALVNVFICFAKLQIAGRLGALWKSEKSSQYAVKTFFFIGLPWVSQSFLYGISANALLGPDLGSAVGWPVLIVTTNTTGLVIGWKLLEEWVHAQAPALNMVKLTVLFSTLGLMIIAIGGFV
jgi:hypothetical protein